MNPSNTRHGKWIVCGLVLMLTCAYYDNLRGPLLPILREVFALTYGETSWFYGAGYWTAVFAVFAVLPLSRRFPSGPLAATVALASAGVGLSALFVTNYPLLIVLACFLGASIAMLGAMGNLLVIEGTSPDVRSRYLCALHTMYGVGSLIGPAVCGWLLSRGTQWSTLLAMNAGPLLVLTAALATGRGPKVHVPLTTERERHRLRWTMRHSWTFIAFAFYVAGELLLSGWLVTYLTDRAGLAFGDATPYLSGFFLMMATTRASCFFFLPEKWERPAVVACLALAMLAFCLGRAGWTPGFCFAGFVGPFFPLMLARMSRDLPKDAQPMTIGILTLTQATMSVCNLLMGYLTDGFGIRVTYWAPVLLIALALASAFRYWRLPVEARG